MHGLRLNFSDILRRHLPESARGVATHGSRITERIIQCRRVRLHQRCDYFQRNFLLGGQLPKQYSYVPHQRNSRRLHGQCCNFPPFFFSAFAVPRFKIRCQCHLLHVFATTWLNARMPRSMIPSSNGKPLDVRSDWPRKES